MTRGVFINVLFIGDFKNNEYHSDGVKKTEVIRSKP